MVQHQQYSIVKLARGLDCVKHSPSIIHTSFKLKVVLIISDVENTRTATIGILCPLESRAVSAVLYSHNFQRF